MKRAMPWSDDEEDDTSSDDDESSTLDTDNQHNSASTNIKPKSKNKGNSLPNIHLLRKFTLPKQYS